MDDKLKIFWNLEVLVKMSRSKNDGPSLRIEELELEGKIKSYRQEIEEIESISDEENYDTSAEMADRNIEIITKKQIQVLRAELKEKNKELNELKSDEKSLYDKTNLLRENKNSQERYITSMQERVGELVEVDVLDRYNGLIAETTEKINELSDELEKESKSYTDVQEKIIEITDKIEKLEEEISKKKNLLSETQAHLENKENYIDHSKTEKNDKRIKDLEGKIEKLETRLEIIRKDPQYLESKIKDIINNKESKKKTKTYLVDLINQVIRVPYINVPADNLLEEELLRATQARDSFANEIDGKTYNILEADTPEKLRIEFLTDRISKWREQLEQYKIKIAEIDHDEQYNYERKERILTVMINSMKNDVKEFERAYEDVSESNIGAKASIKAALDEKREDLIEAEKIATLFRKDEANDIAHATRTIKCECDQINKNIEQANDEIQKITNRLTSKKSGLIDISTRNKDKDTLKEIAQIVIDIKHRRQFPETPIEIIERLEEDLNIDLHNSIDMDEINNSKELIARDYDEYYTKNTYDIEENDIKVEDETIEEELQESYDENSVEKFNEAFDKLINEEDETSEDENETTDIGNETIEEETAEEDKIAESIDTFTDNNDIVSDHSGPEGLVEESDSEKDNEEVSSNDENEPISDIVNEDTAEVLESPTEIIEEIIEELPIEESTQDEEIIPANQESIDEQIDNVIDESNELTIDQTETIEEVPFETSIEQTEETQEIQPETQETEPMIETSEEIVEQQIEQPTEQIIEQPTVQTTDQPIEETIFEAPPLEYQPDDNPFAEIASTQPVEQPSSADPVEQVQQFAATPEFSSGAITQEQNEYQDITNNQPEINVTELIAQEQNPQVVAPDGNEYIELSSDQNLQPEFSNSEMAYQNQTITDNIQTIENINTETQNNDNIYSSAEIENELDNYINSLEEQNS